MRSVTLKWMMLIASLLVTTIVVVQLYWLNKVYSYEQKQFNSNVVRSIRGLLEDIDLADYPATDLHRIIQHPDPSSFLVVIDSIPPKDSLCFI
jgi:two-component system phosphate regulon sensor histidine kinase PhoR